jgi:poly(hydroxyalkanoate) granule-associated protein
MADKPTINVTRGRRDRSQRNGTPTRDASAQESSGLPGPLDVVAGAVQGARRLWLAGLGVLGVVEDSSAAVFDALVEEGREWHRVEAEKRAERARRVEQLRTEPDDAPALETRLQRQIDTLLTQAGLPRKEDVETLRAQIDDLTATVDRLTDAIEASAADDDAD